tara:strand:- start:730 stop:1509 length:780 start_codon:yes stop_codon:yes gene_type:complete
MFSKKLKPVFVKKSNLIRIGPKRDGGYVLDKRIIKKIEYIITCGLSDDWEFEKEFSNMNNRVEVLAFDHTVNSRFWIKRFAKDLINIFLFKKLRIWKIIKIFRYIDYLNFFSKKNKHLKLMISNKNISNKEITINKILKQKKNVLLKVDIEGSEYKILNNILINRKKINCLIIEFHSVKKNLSKIYKFIDKLKNLKLMHVHGNNVNKIELHGYPYALELTFVNSKKIKYKNTTNLREYPIADIDYPSVKRNEDIKLIFN